MIKNIIFLMVFYTSAFSVKAQVSFKGYGHLFTEPLQYNIFKVNDSITVDGKLNEASWLATQWSADFKDIEGGKKAAPIYRTRFKMLWDQSHLYIAAELEDPAIWANLTQRDAVVFHDNDFEVFIDPDGDAQNYFEIEINAVKNVFDLFLTKPYKDGGSALINWDAASLKVGVDIDGTLNKPNDKDKKWTVEMSIPFRSVSIGNNIQIPKDKTIWRINFSRVEWDTEVRNGVYKKITNPATGKNLPEHNWVWSPQGVINMHLPERWGYVQFLNEKPLGNKSDIQLPATEQLKKLLWLLYYKQKNYYRDHSHFTSSLDSLDFPAGSFENSGRSYTVQLEATANLFQATLKDNISGEIWRINQVGELSKEVKRK